MASIPVLEPEQPGDKLKELVRDAVALLGAERIPDLGNDLVLWRIPSKPGSWQTPELVMEAVRLIGIAGWE